MNDLLKCNIDFKVFADTWTYPGKFKRINAMQSDLLLRWEGLYPIFTQLVRAEKLTFIQMVSLGTRTFSKGTL